MPSCRGSRLRQRSRPRRGPATGPPPPACPLERACPGSRPVRPAPWLASPPRPSPRPSRRRPPRAARRAAVRTTRFARSVCRDPRPSPDRASRARRSTARSPPRSSARGPCPRCAGPASCPPLAGKEPVIECGPRTPHVQITGWAGGEADLHLRTTRDSVAGEAGAGGSLDFRLSAKLIMMARC